MRRETENGKLAFQPNSKSLKHTMVSGFRHHHQLESCRISTPLKGSLHLHLPDTGQPAGAGHCLLRTGFSVLHYRFRTVHSSDGRQGNPPHTTDPLHVPGTGRSLQLNLVFYSGTGWVFWWIAAYLTSPHKSPLPCPCIVTESRLFLRETGSPQCERSFWPTDVNILYPCVKMYIWWSLSENMCVVDGQIEWRPYVLQSAYITGGLYQPSFS